MPSPSLARPLFPQQRLRAWPAALLAAALPLVATSAPLPLADRPPAPGKDTHHALCHANYCVLVDGTGNRLGAYQTKAISTFTNGLAVFDDYDGVGKGIIDATGKVVVHGQFYSLKVHGNGLIQARASEYGGDLSYYDRTGKRVRHFEAGGTGRRHHARSWAGAPTVEQCNNDVCTTSVLGADGRTLAEFASLKELDGHDFAAASRDGRTFGLIDTQLAWKGRGDYADIRAAGKVLLAERDGGRTVLDAQGRELLPLADYQEMGRLDTGMYIATLPNSQTCLYFTAKGEALSPKRDDCVQGGGAALGYYIFANQQGSYVATLEGEAMSPMMGPVLMPLNRRAVLQVDHEWRAGTATPQGKPLLPCSYKGLKAFVENGTTTVLRDDLLVAHVEEGVGLLDLRGDWRIAPRYEEIVPLSTTLVAARADDEQWQILDITGTAIDAASSTLPARVPLPDGSSGFVVQSGEFHGLLGEDGRWRVPPRYAEVASVGGAVLVYRQAPAAGEATARFYDLASHSEQPEPLLVSASERADGLIEGIGVDGLMHLLTAEGRILASLPSERPTSATGPYAPPLTCSSSEHP